MITLKYCKKPPAVFISHIDTLRSMVKTIRRADVAVEYSKGFNPHMLLYFSPPLALGISSEAEYVSVEAKGISAEDFLQRYNLSVPLGFEGAAAFETAANPNLAGKITAADYLFPCAGIAAERAAREVEKSTEYSIFFTQKGKDESKEIRGKIFKIEVAEKGLILRLATGNDNLRADRLAAQLNADFGTDIKITTVLKLRQFIGEKEDFEEVDGFLKRQVKPL